MGDEEKKDAPKKEKKFPFQPQGIPGEDGKVIKETVQWEERFNLRAMTTSFVILVLWIIGWGWLSFKVFLGFAAQSERVIKDATGNPIKDEAGNPVKEKLYVSIDGKKTIPKDEYDLKEEVIKDSYKEKTSAFAFLGKNNVNFYIFLVIAGLPFLMILYRAIYKKVSVSYVLTDYRLIVREGLFIKREYQIRLIQIRDLAVYQGLVQLMLGVGTIRVFSNDADTPELHMDGIRDPVHRKEIIYKISEQKKVEKEFYMGQA